MHSVTASPEYETVIRSVADLLTRQRIANVFLGGVARAAHLGWPAVTAGSVDVLGVMAPEQKNPVVMMATHRGFSADKEAIEASEELDLIPLTHGPTRVHVLVASNALYGRMVADGVAAFMGDLELRVPTAEDFALLLQMSGDEEGVRAMAAADGFDRTAYNRKLTSIGLRAMVIGE